MVENKHLSSISKASSYEEMGAFWDEHDLTDFDDMSRPDVEFEIHESIRIEPTLFVNMMRLAHQRGITIETLANLWLQEKVHQSISALAG